MNAACRNLLKLRLNIELNVSKHVVRCVFKDNENSLFSTIKDNIVDSDELVKPADEHCFHAIGDLIDAVFHYAIMIIEKHLFDCHQLTGCFVSC